MKGCWRVLIVAAALIALAVPATAQIDQGRLTGTATDAQGAVLPGVTVTAKSPSLQGVRSVVTEADGKYSISPLPSGEYELTFELSGFQSFKRGNLRLGLGQILTVDAQLQVATLQESVTVTAEAPLVDVTQSKLGGNIDQRQMQELPVNGRNWLDLTQLAPGSRANAGGGNAGDDPLPRGNGTYQLNVDGQQVTNTNTISFGQPHFSRDAIAEFELVTNRFDATQGRSSGIQVNAVTKSGTNIASGTAAG